jgi:hypothetical protein
MASDDRILTVERSTVKAAKLRLSKILQMVGGSCDIAAASLSLLAGMGRRGIQD